MSDQGGEQKGEPKSIIPAGSILPPEIREAIQKIAENSSTPVEPQVLEKALLAVMTKISISYSRKSPLPPPQELSEYERIVPGSAARIIASSEKQLNHRLGLEKQTITTQNIQSARGQIFGFIVAVMGFLCAFGAIMADHAVAGSVIGTIDLVALVSVFVYGKTAMRVDLEKKAKAVPPPDEKKGPSK